MSHRWLPGGLAGLICQLRSCLLDTLQDGCRLWVFPVGRGFHVANGCHLVNLRLDTALIDNAGRGGVVREVVCLRESWQALPGRFGCLLLGMASPLAGLACPAREALSLADILLLWLDLDLSELHVGSSSLLVLQSLS